MNKKYLLPDLKDETRMISDEIGRASLGKECM